MLMRNEKEAGSDRAAMRRRSRRGLRVAVAVAVLAVLAAGSYAYVPGWLGRGDVVPLRTADVVLGDVEKTVTSIGTIKPRDYVDVGTQVSGQLRAIHVAIGDRVEQGDLLAEIDPTVYEARVRADRARLADLQAQLVQRKAELDLSRLQHERNRRLFAADAISENELQTGQSRTVVAAAIIESLQAQIAQAQSTLDGDLANLGYTKIHAPMTGTIVSISAVKGQTLNANQTAPIVARVADLQTMTVWAQVAEADVVALVPGMPVYFTTLGLPERRWRSTLRQILPTPEIINDVVLYNALIDVENADGVLMSDMTAQIFFVLGQARGVPTVPMSALRPDPGGEGNRYRVDVVTPGGIEARTVTAGLTTRTTAEIASGLAVGDRVVLGGGSAAGVRPAGGRPGGPMGGPRL